MSLSEPHGGDPRRALAEAAGILDAYVDMEGVTRETTDDTRARLLAAMGIDAGDDAAAWRTLDELRAREVDALLPPTRVTTRAGQGAAECAPVLARVPLPEGSLVAYDLEVHEEGGAR